MLAVNRPANVRPGAEIIVESPDGRRFRTQVPEGVAEGGIFHVKIPPAPPEAQAAVLKRKSSKSQASTPPGHSATNAARTPQRSGSGAPRASSSSNQTLEQIDSQNLTRALAESLAISHTQHRADVEAHYRDESEDLARALAESLAMSRTVSDTSDYLINYDSFHEGSWSSSKQDGMPCVPAGAVLPSTAEARQLMECSICFDDLSSESCAVFVNQQAHRVCTHTFHERCAQGLPSKCCPMCRTEYTNTMRIPSLISDAAAWFDVVDIERIGRVSKSQATQIPFMAVAPRFLINEAQNSWSQVLQMMMTQYPLDANKLENAMDDLWLRFDESNSGQLFSAINRLPIVVVALLG